MRKTRSIFLGMLAAASLVGCDTPTGTLAGEAGVSNDAILTVPSSSDPQNATLGSELAAARAGSARYQSLDVALADGYVDINVVVPGMGHHFLNPALVDETFDPGHPEILVYSPQGDRMRLVAVEYAVPLGEPEPDGFSGDSDAWDGNEGFGLWLLHAWVWHNNPDGIFTALNPRLFP